MEQLAWNEAFRSRMLERAGDATAALAAGRRAEERNEKVGSAIGRALSQSQHGMALVLNGDWEASRDRLEAGLAIARENRVWLSLEADYLAGLAEAYLGLGDGERARSASMEAVQIARERETLICELRAHLAVARVLLSLDGAPARREIESALDRAHAIARTTGARSYEPIIHEERANVARALGDEAAREHELAVAHRLFTEMGATGHAERVAKELT